MVADWHTDWQTHWLTAWPTDWLTDQTHQVTSYVNEGWSSLYLNSVSTLMKSKYKPLLYHMFVYKYSRTVTRVLLPSGFEMICCLLDVLIALRIDLWIEWMSHRLTDWQGVIRSVSQAVSQSCSLWHLFSRSLSHSIRLPIHNAMKQLINQSSCHL